MNIKINKDFGPYKKDQIVNVEGEKIPSDVYWRRRLQDSKIDGCCEIVPKKVKKVKSTEKVN